MGHRWLLLLALAASQVPLSYQVFSSNSFPDSGGAIRYQFTPQPYSSVVMLLLHSSFATPHLYLSFAVEPTPGNCTWKGTVWAPGVALLSAGGWGNSGTYHALVVCDSSCDYNVTYFAQKTFASDLGKYLISPVQAYSLTAISVESKYSRSDDLFVRVSVRSLEPSARFIVAIGSEEFPTPSTSVPLHALRPTGYDCVLKNPRIVQFLLFRVMLLALSDFTVQAVALADSHALPSSFIDSAGPDSFAYYYYWVKDFNRTVEVQMTALIGDPKMFIGFSPITFRNYYWTADTFNSTAYLYIPAQATDMYIGVYSPTESSFFLTLDGAGYMYSGLPTSGRTIANKPAYGYLNVSAPASSHSITFYLHTMEGNASLYVRLCSSKAGCSFTPATLAQPELYDLVTSRDVHGNNRVKVTYRANTCNDSAACQYHTAVVSGEAATDTRFSLLAIIDEIETGHRLIPGEAITITAEPGYEYFQYQASGLEVVAVTFTVTPITASPLFLYVSRNNTKPSRTDFEQSAPVLSRFHPSAVTIYCKKRAECTYSAYYVSVYSPQQSAYTIVSSEKVLGKINTVVLKPDQPQQGVLLQGNTYEFSANWYQLKQVVSEHSQNLRIKVTQMFGQVAFCAGRHPKAMTSCSAGSTQTTRYLTIPLVDAESDTFYVNVEYVSGVRASASYVLSYEIETANTHLQANVPSTDEVAKGNYRDYRFAIIGTASDYSLETVVSHGLVGVYVLLSRSDTKPRKQHSLYSFAVFGSEELRIPRETLNEKCVDSLRGHFLNCTLYIAVYGYENATFTLRVSERQNEIRTLPLDESSTGVLTTEHSSHYYATLTQANVVTSLRMQSSEGDAALLLNVLNYNASDAEAEWPRPTEKAASLIANESHIAEMSADMLQSHCPSGVCVFVTGIECQSQLCKYTLTTSQNRVWPIQEGVVNTDFAVADTYTYYSFFNQYSEGSIRITLTRFSDAYPEIYVSQGIHNRPAAGDSTWQSTFGEELLISSTDPMFYGSESSQGFYVIGVHAVFNTSFSLVVTTSPEPVTQVSNGVPVEGKLSTQGVRYFSYTHIRDLELTLQLTPLYGSATIGVTVFDNAKYRLRETLPGKENSTWHSGTFNHTTTLTIAPSDSGFCTNCVYLIGVFAESEDCAFSLTLTAEEKAVVLQNGIPSKGQVNAFDWKLYEFFQLEHSELELCILILNGDADLYVNTENHVNVSSALWTNTEQSYVKHIHIPHTDSNFNLGRFSIGVYGNTNTAFIITAHVRESYISLVDDWPQAYSFIKSEGGHLKLRYLAVASTAQIAICHVRGLDKEFYPRVFVSSTSTQQPLNRTNFFDPIPANAQFAFSSEEYNRSDATLSFSLPLEQSGQYLIAVYGMDSQQSKMGTVVLSCSKETIVSAIVAGETVHGLLSRTVPKRHFKLFVPKTSLLKITATSCVGCISLTVSSNFTLPNKKTDIAVSNQTNGEIQAEVVSAEGTYFVTLNKLQGSGDAAFELRYDLYSIDPKPPGKAVAGEGGHIKWELSDSDTISLRWAALEYDSGSLLGHTVSYVVYSTNVTLKMTTVSEIRAAETLGLVSASPPLSDAFAVIPICGGDTMRVNVLGVVTTGADTVAIPYTPLEISIQRKTSEGSNKSLLIGFATLAFVMVIVILVVIYLRCRWAKSRLERQPLGTTLSADRLDPSIELQQGHGKFSS